MNPSPPLALLACEVFSSEIALHAREATHIVETRWLEVGLHDQPDNLRRALQREVEALDARDDIQAVVLAYGLCGLGTAGLTASRHPVVIARAHDCITVFLGSKEAYADCQRRCPGCHYYTPGWNRERRVPGPDRTEMLRARFSEKFDPEGAYRRRWLAEGNRHAPQTALDFFAAVPKSWQLVPGPALPAPLVDLVAGRDRALAAYASRSTKDA